MTEEQHWHRWLSVLVGIGAGGVFLFLAVRRVNLDEVRLALAGADLRWLIPIILVLLMSFWIRALRWSAMFPPGQRPPTIRTLNAFLVGLLINNVLPGRLGEVLRIGVIKRHVPAVSISTILATVVLERVFDGLVLLLLLALVLVVAPLPAWVSQMGILGAALFLGVLVVLLLLNTRGGLVERWLQTEESSALPWGIGKLLTIGKNLLCRFSLGLSALNTGRTMGIVSGQSLLVWLAEAVVMAMTFRVFHLSLPFAAATVTLVVLSLGMMIPSAPGFIGSYQFFIMSSLQLYAVSPAQALAVGLFLNLVVFALGTLSGVVALLAEWPLLWGRHASKEAESNPLSK